MTNFKDEILPWIGHTSKMIDFYHSQLLKKYGFDLTKEQWVLLKMLSQHNGISQGEIACLSNRDKTSMARLVANMEKKNLVARMSSEEDRRINLLFITKYGKKTLEQTVAFKDKFVDALKKEISDKQIADTIKVLNKIQQNIQANGSKCN